MCQLDPRPVLTDGCNPGFSEVWYLLAGPAPSQAALSALGALRQLCWQNTLWESVRARELRTNANLAHADDGT